MSDELKSSDIPTTKKMLEETRDELKASIASVKLDVSAVREEMKSEFSGVRSEISGVRSEISEVRSEIKELTAAVHRALALHEDQNSRNRYVLDGHQSLHDRQDKYESETNERIDQIEAAISKMNTTN